MRGTPRRSNCHGYLELIASGKPDFLEDFDFLYHLTRSTRASIMLLAQNVQVSKRIDDATYSSFLPTKVYFKEYGADELYQILRMRAEDGLNEWDDATLKLVAAVMARDYRGDARIAIRALFRVAVSNAWRDEERARMAVAEASREVEEMSLRELKDHNLLVLYAVSKARETNKAYNIFNEYARTVQHRAYSKTAFFRALNHLQNLGLITQVKKRVGRYFTIEVDLLIDEKKVEAGGKRKVKKKVRKCYLGPQTYRYVEKLHELGLSGPIDRERFKRYFRELLGEVDLSPGELISMIEELGLRLLEDLDLAEADRGLAERLRGCYQLLLKAYGKVATKLYSERFTSRAT